MIALLIALHVEALDEISLAEATPVIEALRAKIDALGGVDAVIDDPTFGCELAERCADEVRARTGAAEVVMIRAIGGPTKIQLTLQRVPGTREVTQLLERAPQSWDRSLSEAVGQLFPEAKPESPPPPPAIAPVVSAGDPPYAAYAVIGAGVATTALAIIFGASNAGARATIRDNILIGPAYDEERDRARSMGMAANVLLPLGLAAIAGGTLWCLVD